MGLKALAVPIVPSEVQLMRFSPKKEVGTGCKAKTFKN
jgi:hypothetical protein